MKMTLQRYEVVRLDCANDIENVITIKDWFIEWINFMDVDMVA